MLSGLVVNDRLEVGEAVRGGGELLERVSVVTRPVEGGSEVTWVDIPQGHILAEDPSAQLGIAGSGPERERLEQQAAELGISEHVRFLGFVSEDRKRALLHESSVFVLPSRQEGFGIAVLEAMATETPVAANDLDIIRRLLPDRPNRFADASDSGSFVAAMMDVLDGETGYERKVSTENRQEAERYSLDASANRRCQYISKCALTPENDSD